MRGKGKHYPIEISFIAWIDLLGYGAMLRDVAFDPSDPRAEAAVNRLKKFQWTVASFAYKHLRAMPINDGTAFFHDLSPRTNFVSYRCLLRAFDVFEKVNKLETAQGYPGARMIVAVGPRMRIPGVITNDPGHKQSIFDRLQNGLISVEQAIHEAFRSGPIAGFVPQLQANFAFTKAFLADEDGTKAGLGGPNCYVDCSLFDEPIPSWASISRLQPWSTRGMSAIFAELKAIDRESAEGIRYRGILNSVQIAERLSIIY